MKHLDHRERLAAISKAGMRELYEERAAIREFDGGMPRHEAESAAVEDVERIIDRRKVRRS